MAVNPPSRPTMPKIEAPRSMPSSSARTRLVETFASRLPPPTENTRIPSCRGQIGNRAAIRQKVESQPSSFTRAVSSETLSVGV